MEKSVCNTQNSGLISRLQTYFQIFLHLSFPKYQTSPSCQSNPSLQKTSREKPSQIILQCILHFILLNTLYLFSFPGLEFQVINLSRNSQDYNKTNFSNLGQLQRSWRPQAYLTFNVILVSFVFYSVMPDQQQHVWTKSFQCHLWKKGLIFFSNLPCTSRNGFKKYKNKYTHIQMFRHLCLW